MNPSEPYGEVETPMVPWAGVIDNVLFSNSKPCAIEIVLAGKDV